MNKIILKINEIPQQHVGRGRAIIDPKVIEDQKWNTGQILELTYNKKTHVKLWPGTPDEYGTGIIKIDGITRLNIGAGIGDKISIKSVEATNAEQITLSPTEKLPIDEEQLHDVMITNFQNHVFTIHDSIQLPTQMGGKIQFIVTNTKPSKPVIVTENTVFKLGSMTKVVDASIPRITYDELGGLKNEVKKIREMVELPMRHPELFDKIGVEAPKGVLLYGPPGTGKTLLAKAVAGETNANFVSLSGPEIMAKHYGESEERLREIFTQAEENSPSIIFIDEIDSIAPKRDEVSGELEKRIVSQLLTLMDGMKSRGKVVVIAATNRPDSIDSALRRPGRFDREIEIGIPDDEGRLDILSIHTRGMPIDDKVDLKQISKTTHGFVGADLEILAKEAAMRSLRRILADEEIDLDEDKISSEILQKIQISNEDFRDALKEVSPSALREVQVQIPDVSWDDVGGLNALKEELREAIEWPIKHKEAFDYIDVESPKGILLHGPPGTGKTLIAKALAKMTESNFISIKGPELLSKWVGESEKGVREIFRKARQAAPCIIFLDEVDALVPRRGSSESHVTESVVSQILTEIDGLEELHNVLIIGATNRLDIVDEALLRPGRFDRIIEVPNPDTKGRQQIFEIHTKKKPLANDVKIEKLVELTVGFSGAEIGAVANRAAIAALKRYVSGNSQNIKEIKISQQDLIDAVDKVKPRKKEAPLSQSIK
ncbi:MAG TPA: CDC48 family AAA ATPase [Nitrosopumilus sp.]|jgi:transitional endoplasmic reticulum ATPase|nr:CDC48 family AAA ATPase [Nitrosopumilus sp.]HJL67199.1 CDC48 family AAA ATPase [Nitrosopumilus sp.]HJM24929.1 CDC48 family AAA ATPase [Nitrosopumilus sp.]HJO31094.1 CDC48 family AAA ATPase [Nitrosopumilus sp.]|tara:strand:+ start:1724 stop:3871 length:2148 start_codon:yes stop_codon:yes gene_type:complete